MSSVFCRLEDLHGPDLPCAVNGRLSDPALLRPRNWDNQAMLNDSSGYLDNTAAGIKMLESGDLEGTVLHGRGRGRK